MGIFLRDYGITNYEKNCILSYLAILFNFDSHQRTPLFKAAVKGHVDTIRYLLDKGADIHINDNEGVSE